MSPKEILRRILKDQLPLKYRIKEVPRNKEAMHKELFIEVVKLLKEINDRTDFVASEIGMDITAYDDKFFRVIENLMRMTFNKEQVFLIELYLNEIDYNEKEEWDGFISVTVNKKEQKIAFRTPEDVWEAIQKPNTVILLDEISRAHPEAWNILMTVLDPGQRYLRLDEAVNCPTIKVADGVSFIGTANIGTEYTAVRVMDRALLDRFLIAEIPFLTPVEECALITQLYPTIDQTIIKNLAEIANQTRSEIKSDSAKIQTPISTRSVLEMAGLLTDGFTLSECAEVSIYPLYSQDGGMQSERTFIKQLVQKYVNDGTADNLMGQDNTANGPYDNSPF